MNKISIPLTIAFIFIGIALPAYSAVKIDSATREIQAETYFAINGTKIFHIPNQLDTTVRQRADWMHELGVTWDRSDWWWHVIEPQQGQFDFTIPDRVVEYMNRQGIQILPILNYGASWFPSDKNAPVTEADRQAFARYVEKVVTRYKNDFTYWEVWNEPNILPFWAPEPNADDYAALLKITSETARKADPDCKLTAPTTAPLGAYDRKFIERLYRLGCKDYFDVFDYHYYRNHPPEDEVPAELADIKALMRRYGDAKPIWITETGVSSPIQNKPESYEKQAALVVRNQLLCLACGVERIFYFDLQNWTDDKDASWDSFLGLVEAGGTPKPAFYAYKTLVQEVDRKQVLGRYRKFGEGIEAVLIYDPQEQDYLMAIWTREEQANRTVDVLCQPKDIKIVYPYGDSEIRSWKGDPDNKNLLAKIPLRVNEHPRYIHSVDPLTYLPEVAIRLSAEKIEIAPGETQPLRLEVDPLLTDFHLLIHTYSLLSDIEWDYQQGKITASEDAKPGIQNLLMMIKASIEIDNRRRIVFWERFIPVEILPALSLKLRPYMEKDELKVLATLENFSSRKNSGILTLEHGFEPDFSPLSRINIQRLEIGHQQQVFLPVNPAVLKKYQIPMSWRLKYQNTFSEPIRIYVAPLRSLAPRIDGILDEWEGIVALPLGIKNQITRNVGHWDWESASALVRLWCTPDALCLGAEVSDNDPLINNHPANEIWRGDSLELYIGLQGPAKRTVIDKAVDFQIGLAPTYSGKNPVVFLYHLDFILKNAKIAAQRTEKGYILEAMIPLAELGEFHLEEGQFLGFDIGLDDLDQDDIALAGTDAGRQLMWNGNSRNWIDPSGWGIAVLKRD